MMRKISHKLKVLLLLFVQASIQAHTHNSKNHHLSFKHSSETTMPGVSSICNSIQDIIGTDAGNRGMKSLIVLGDLEKAANAIASLEIPSTVVILSGFPCCVNESPPTETDG
jgi:hypothetical protein